MPSGKKASPEIEAKILELRKQGRLYREIRSELGISGNTLKRVLNPEAHKKRQLGRRRRSINVFRLRRNGVDRYVRVDGRRPRPDRCELCSGLPIRKNLSWHHWDNKHPGYGLWLCLHCHIFAEQIDKGIEQRRYLELKKQQEARPNPG